MKIRSYLAALALLFAFASPPVLATVDDNGPRVAYTASGGQTAFTYTFEILAATDLKVYKNGVALVYSSDYTVSGVGAQSGGTVTLLSAASLNDTVVIYRDQALSRTTDYQAGAKLNPDTLDLDLDRVVLGVQQIERDVARSIHITPYDTRSDSSLSLPSASTRASKYLAFDTDGDVTVTTGTAAASPSSLTSINDVGAYYTATNVEDALQEIIASNVVRPFGTIALLEAATPRFDGEIVQVTCYYTCTAPDGSGGTFKWVAANTDTADGGVTFAADAGGTGRWKRVDLRSMTFLSWGAVGDGVTDDTAELQAYITWVKAGWDNTYQQAPCMNGAPGVYLVTSPLFIGSSTSSGGRLSCYHGNGSTLLVKHTGIGVDATGLRDASDIDDLRIQADTVTSPSIGFAIVRRSEDDGGNGHRNVIRRLKITGTVTVAGLVNFASESNTWIHLQVDVSSPYAAAVIGDTGKYWNGASFTAMTFPNVGSPAPQPGDSTTNNHFLGARFSNTHAAGVSALQLIGGGKHTFEGTFFNTSNISAYLLHFLGDTGSGGDPGCDNTSFYGLNVHESSTNAVNIRVENGTVRGMKIYGPVLLGGTTADFQSAAGTLVVDSHIEAEKIDILGTATGHNTFLAGTSFSAASTVEGTLLTSGGATVTLSGNNGLKRLNVIEAESGRRYGGRDSRTFTPVSTSGTGEDNLSSYTINGSANFMGAAGRSMRVRATGTKTNANGNKTIKFHLGASNWTVFPAANDVLDWAFEADIYTSASNAQTLFLKFYQNGALTYAAPVTAAIDLVGTSPVMKLTGEAANGADVITQTSFIVEAN